MGGAQRGRGFSHKVTPEDGARLLADIPAAYLETDLQRSTDIIRGSEHSPSVGIPSFQDVPGSGKPRP